MDNDITMTDDDSVGRAEAQESIRRAAEAQGAHERRRTERMKDPEFREAYERERIVAVLSGFEVDADSCEEMADAIMAALSAPVIDDPRESPGMRALREGRPLSPPPYDDPDAR